jgi:hypothetical protein
MLALPGANPAAFPRIQCSFAAFPAGALLARLPRLDGCSDASGPIERVASVSITTDAVLLALNLADRHFQPMQDCLLPHAGPN